jgi:preprotein translocase subunit SecE|tara:strand:- start:17895 stop:18242 length:348 start_codon:yes stop_codon:yes gene_type:complete
MSFIACRQCVLRLKDGTGTGLALSFVPSGLKSVPLWRRCAKTKRVQDITMATKTNPLQFIQQVRAEVTKIVWPTRREVLLTTMMVFVMAALVGTFFFLVDLGIRFGLQGFLSLFG